MEGIALTHDAQPESNQLKKFTVGVQAYANKLKLPLLYGSIEDMVELKETNFVKTDLDTTKYMKEKDDGTAVVDEVMKEKVKAKWVRINNRELDLKDKYDEGKMTVWNAMHLQCDDPVLAGIRDNIRYEKAKEDVAIIQLLRILKDVINKGQFGAQHDDIATSLKQCQNFFNLEKGNQSVAQFAETLVEHYDMQIDLFGQLAFGENLMLDIIAACRGAARSSIKLKTYYKGNEREKAEWADKYKHNIVARFMVLHCNNRSIRDKTDEAIRLDNGRYPTTIQAASALLTATFAKRI